MNRKTHIIPLMAVGVLALSLTGCYFDKSKRNIEYSPNMYNSLPLEPYSQTVYHDTDIGGNFPAVGPGEDKVAFFKDGLSAQRAPEGTVARKESWYRQEAFEAYPLPNTPEAYEQASTMIFSPLDNPTLNAEGIQCTEASFNRGKELYEQLCTMCHGANGNGQGSLVTKGALAGVPSYSGPQLAGLSVGKMYHSITYGKNLMGSYASQMSPQQRWEVICYIQQFFDAAPSSDAASAATETIPAPETASAQ